MRTLSRIAAAVTGGVLFAACAGSPGGRAPAASDEERHAYHAAKRELATDPAAAERAFTAFLDVWPRSALAPKAAALLGTIASDRGDADEALLRYRKALARFPNSETSDSLRVRIAHDGAGQEHQVIFVVTGIGRISRSIRSGCSGPRGIPAADPVTLRAREALRARENRWSCSDCPRCTSCACPVKRRRVRN